MKTKVLCLYVMVIVLSSCAPAHTDLPTSSNLVTPSASPTFISSPTSTITPVTPISTPEIPPSPEEIKSAFIQPEPETYVMVLPAVLKYFYYRKKAMISGNAEDLWTQYPELRSGTDITKGINAESFFISNYQSLKLFDGNIFPEYYEQMKIKVRSDEIEVLVHGMELYLYLDENGQFNESGGEFKIVLFLRMKDGQWDVIKTDEVLQNEWQKFSP